MLKFEFSEQDAQIILNALAARPYGEVANVIQSFQMQAAQQMNPQPVVAAAVEAAAVEAAD